MSTALGWVVGYYGLCIIAFLVILWISIKYYDQRYRRRKKDDQRNTMLAPEFVPTAEVFIDPKDGKKYRVYYNERTGEREYVEQ
ncbi:hypothetical protein JCM10914A_26010 [Paenibacillus sp. JCM 10914]|uniref:hypothetical protein n=1 Tax=Paenibacillus sp. JCM 10914 TaxID=1236974 RepID=UPI000560C811|nr:hypothetical protein [Paenibacillus sp. JCM 10914]